MNDERFARLPRSSVQCNPHRARARTRASTHAPTHDHARCSLTSSSSCIAENANARVCNALRRIIAHYRRLSALDCRSDGNVKPKRVSASSGFRFPCNSHLSWRSRGHFVPSSRRTCASLPLTVRTHLILHITPPAYHPFFFLTCHLPVASLRAHSH